MSVFDTCTHYIKREEKKRKRDEKENDLVYLILPPHALSSAHFSKLCMASSTHMPNNYRHSLMILLMLLLSILLYTIFKVVFTFIKNKSKLIFHVRL